MLLSIYVFSCTQTILKKLIPLFVVPKLRKKIHLKRNILTNKGKNLFKLTKNKEKISITWYFPLLFYKKVVIYVSTFIFLLGKYSAVLHYIPLFENECSNYTFPSICPSWKKRFTEVYRKTSIRKLNEIPSGYSLTNCANLINYRKLYQSIFNKFFTLSHTDTATFESAHP